MPQVCIPYNSGTRIQSTLGNWPPLLSKRIAESHLVCVSEPPRPPHLGPHIIRPLSAAGYPQMLPEPVEGRCQSQRAKAPQHYQPNSGSGCWWATGRPSCLKMQTLRSSERTGQWTQGSAFSHWATLGLKSLTLTQGEAVSVLRAPAPGIKAPEEPAGLRLAHSPGRPSSQRPRTLGPR